MKIAFCFVVFLLGYVLLTAAFIGVPVLLDYAESESPGWVNIESFVWARTASLWAIAFTIIGWAYIWLTALTAYAEAEDRARETPPPKTHTHSYHIRAIPMTDSKDPISRKAVPPANLPFAHYALWACSEQTIGLFLMADTEPLSVPDLF